MSTVKIVVAAQPVQPGACELCTFGPATLGDAVAIHHSDGSAVVLVACERCARAARRIVAAVGLGASLPVVDVGPAVGVRPPSPPRPGRIAAAPELIRELVDLVADVDGTSYVVRVYGQPRVDGTWVGWIAFVAVGVARTMRTGVETTQPDRAALAYWCGGLEASYLEGALKRARLEALRSAAIV